jgi:uncharacterized membrane protein YdjX (TVP38/TMEM64 family)
MVPHRNPRRAVAAILGATALVAAAALLPIRPWLASFAVWARGAGTAGLLGFALAQVACTLLLVPTWPLRVAAGFVWGFAGGFALVMPTSVAASVLAFMAGRRLLRERVAHRVAREPRLRALDSAVAGSGFWMVLLLRLSPVIPNEVVNYGLGLTRVPLGEYALASFLGMIPATATYVAAGSLVTAAAELAAVPSQLVLARRAVTLVGLAATIAFAVLGARLVRRALERNAARAGQAPALAPSLQPSGEQP